jgi:anti-sigma B factor antagonist
MCHCPQKELGSSCSDDLNDSPDPSSTSKQFHITITRMACNRVILAVTGPMDWTTVSAVRVAALDEIASGARRLVLDLAEVDFLDSSGMGVIASAYRDAALVGASVVLAGLSPALEKRYRGSGLHIAVPPYRDVPSALAFEDCPRDLDIGCDTTRDHHRAASVVLRDALTKTARPRGRAVVPKAPKTRWSECDPLCTHRAVGSPCPRPDAPHPDRVWHTPAAPASRTPLATAVMAGRDTPAADMGHQPGRCLCSGLR